MLSAAPPLAANIHSTITSILESPGSPRARQRRASNLVRPRGATEEQSLTFILSLSQRERRGLRGVRLENSCEASMCCSGLAAARSNTKFRL